MRFMITFNHTDGVWDGLSPAQQEEHGKWLGEFVAQLRDQKGAELVFLGFPEQRKHVRMHDDRSVTVEDGPAIASSEQVGGYYIIEADSMDEALEWARKGRFMPGSNEVRAILSPPPT